MSLETCKLEKGLCRCCFNDGSYKNLAEPCLDQGQQVIYADLVRKCFNIDLSPVLGPLCAVTYMICDDCIQRLRDAHNFKQQIVQTEERFQELYGKNNIKFASGCEILVKQEITDNDSQDVKPALSPFDDDDDNSLHNDDGDHKFEIEVEFPKEPNKTKTKKALKTKAKNRGKPRGRPRTLIVTQQEKDGDKERKGGSSSAPKFRLHDADFTTEGDVYKCAKCDKPYDKISSLKHHVKTKHYNIPRFICPYCSEGFMTPAPLAVHKLKEHNVDDRFKCNACKGAFNTKIQLRKHINNFHMLGEKHKCQFCDYESFSFESLYKHKFKHRTVKDYRCRFCTKAFLRKTTLDLHERIHTGDRRKVCSVCSKAFVQKASLNYHMAKYHPEVNF